MIVLLNLNLLPNLSSVMSWIGFAVETNFSYFPRFLLAVVPILAMVVAKLRNFFVNPHSVSLLGPLGLGLCMVVFNYATFFSTSYWIQRELAPWWLDPLMWVGHVVLLSLYAASVFSDPGAIPPHDLKDRKQRRKVDKLIVALAENGVSSAWLNPETGFAYSVFRCVLASL